MKSSAAGTTATALLLLALSAEGFRPIISSRNFLGARRFGRRIGSLNNPDSYVSPDSFASGSDVNSNRVMRDGGGAGSSSSSAAPAATVPGTGYVPGFGSASSGGSNGNIYGTDGARPGNGYLDEVAGGSSSASSSSSYESTSLGDTNGNSNPGPTAETTDAGLNSDSLPTSPSSDEASSGDHFEAPSPGSATEQQVLDELAADLTPIIRSELDDVAVQSTSELWTLPVPGEEGPDSGSALSQADMFEGRLAKLESMMRSNLGGLVLKDKLNEALGALTQTNEQISFLASKAREFQASKVELSEKLDLACDKLAQANERLESQERLYANQVSQLEAKCRELDEWDSVDVSWEIKDFVNKLVRPDMADLWSDDVEVAGYRLRLNLDLAAMDNQRLPETIASRMQFHTDLAVPSSAHNDLGAAYAERNVGVYLCHSGGLNFVPISIGGSHITMIGVNPEDRYSKYFAEDVRIGSVNTGRGWTDFATAGTVRERFLHNGRDLVLQATIRVARLKKFMLSST